MEDSEPDEVDKLKAKFMSAWHNVKYSWVVRTKTNFSRNSPVFLLGKCYHFKSEGMDKSASGCTDAAMSTEMVLSNVNQFREDFISRIWLTYRREFPQLKGCTLTTDCGWGCTLRTGQMLLAQSLLLHFLGRVYIADVIEKYLQGVGSGSPTSSDRRAVLILIPVRLGGEKVNPEYKEIVKGILSLEFCVGIIGGKPKQSFYFVGFQDDSLIYMDPHYCQSFVDVSTKDFPLESYHCPSPKKMSFSKMDPSCTIGFYSHNEYDFEKIIDEVSKVLNSLSSKEKYPLFIFSKGHARDYDIDKLCTPKTDSAVQHSETQRRKAERLSNEEFVLL